MTLTPQASGGKPAGPMEVTRAIETVRWHTVRYDVLRASAASRASFVIGADSVLIAGVALLIPSTHGQSGWIARSLTWVATAGALFALLFAGLSIISAANSFLSPLPWRKLFGGPNKWSAFYQHSDTLAIASSYDDFEALFVEQTVDDELTSSIVNLWLVIKTHAYRYGHLRRSIRRLKEGILILTFSVSIVLVLNQIGA
jgi:hypothetical protein